MPSKFLISSISLCTLVLAGCGGSSSAPELAVSDIAVNQLKYGQLSQFTLTGNFSDNEINVSTKNCKGLALVEGGTTTTKSVTLSLIHI